MKKILLVLLIILSVAFLFPKNASAAVTQCDPVTQVPCTKCTWQTPNGPCVVSNSSTCSLAGYVPDSSFCQNLNSLQCDTMIWNCIAPTPPPTGGPTPTPSQCFECVDTVTGCIPRSVGDSRCEYDTYSACHDACTGQTPTRFNCVNGDCTESGGGTYANIGDCTAACTSGNSDLWCPGFENQKLNTAIGCIPILTTKEAFLSFILKWAVGIGGGIAFLLIIYAGFMIMTSAGNPERLKAGQELLTSAISGLILLIFSVVILKIIGVDILGLCKFGFGTGPCPP